MDAKVKEQILGAYKVRCISNRDFLDDMQRISRVRKCAESLCEQTEHLLMNQMICLINVFGDGVGLVMELKTDPEFWPTLYTLLEELGQSIPSGPRDEVFKDQLRAMLRRNSNHAKIFESLH